LEVGLQLRIDGLIMGGADPALARRSSEKALDVRVPHTPERMVKKSGDSQGGEGEFVRILIERVLG